LKKFIETNDYQSIALQKFSQKSVC